MSAAKPRPRVFLGKTLAAGAIHSPRGSESKGLPQKQGFCGMAREFYSLERLWQDGTLLDVGEFLT